MIRRDFLKNSVLGSAALLTGARVSAAANSPAVTPAAAPSAGGFKLKYGPHIGMFKEHAGPDPVDQLKFMADQGFTAFEDNGMPARPVDVQEKMAAAMSKLGITMGVFVSMADFKNPTFVSADASVKEKILTDMRLGVEVAKRVNAKWTTIAPGCYDLKLDAGFQEANAIDMFRRCAEICEPSGLVIVMEPLNTHTNHPGVWLQSVPQAYAICRAVNSPSCKVLYDMYHAQIQVGNIIPNIDLAWSEVPYYQVGDNPGRKEPGTGEVNWRNIFKHLYEKGFKGVIGMEHGNSIPGKEGELAVIKAYRDADNF
jgi:hydroxypyruvate isomerase